MGLCEESSVLEFASVSLVEVNLDFSYTEDALIDGNFKSLMHSDKTDNNGGSKEFAIVFQDHFSRTFITAFV